MQQIQQCDNSFALYEAFVNSQERLLTLRTLKHYTLWPNDWPPTREWRTMKHKTHCMVLSDSYVGCHNMEAASGVMSERPLTQVRVEMVVMCWQGVGHVNHTCPFGSVMRFYDESPDSCGRKKTKKKPNLPLPSPQSGEEVEESANEREGEEDEAQREKCVIQACS